MKIRNGFVSNSSTSSFCIIGFDIGKDKKALAKVKKLNKGLGIGEENDDDYFDDYTFTDYLQEHLKIDDIIFRVGNGENECESGEVVVGILLADNSSDDSSNPDPEEFNLQDFSKKLEKIRNTFGIKCINPTKYTGNRMS